MIEDQEKPKEEEKFTFEFLDDDLDERIKIFCKEYIVDWVKARSYMKAYPDSSYESAAVSANRLLKKAKIKQYIEYIKDDIAKEAGISKLSIIKELKLLAFSNLPLIILKYEEGGLSALSEDEQKCIIEYTENKKQIGEDAKDGEEESATVLDKTVKFKLDSKRGSLVDLLKAMEWNGVEKVELSGEVNVVNTDQYTEEEKLELLKLARKNGYTG